ncbi:MAG: response regulator, partial [Burkholderiales bacterium]
MATILIVEDEPDIQELIAYNVERAGHEVVRAGNAEQALELVRDVLPHLILIDWMLPGMN